MLSHDTCVAHVWHIILVNMLGHEILSNMLLFQVLPDDVRILQALGLIESQEVRLSEAAVFI